MRITHYKQSIVGWYRKFSAKHEDYVDSVWEFLLVYLFSNIPYIALVLVHLLGTENAHVNFSTLYTVIAQNVKSGEILIYVSTLLAPFVYVMWQYHRSRKNFPLYGLFVFLTGAVYFYCLIVFSMYRTGSIKNAPLVEDTSLYFYFLALVLWYFSLVFARKLQKMMRPVPEKSGAQQLLDSLGESGQ